MKTSIFEKTRVYINSIKYLLSGYLGLLPQFIQYQALSYIFLWLVLWLLKKAGMFLIYSTGRVAVTSGDFTFLFTSWQGWLILILVFIALFFAVSININGNLLLASKALRGEEIHMLPLFKEAVLSLTRFFNRDGIFICLYIGLAAPLTGIGFTLTQTARLYVPHFITDVIYKTPKYMVIYVLLMTILVIFGLRNLYVLPFVILEKCEIREGVKKSHALIRSKWRETFAWLFVITLGSSLALSAATLLLRLGVSGIQFLLPLPVVGRRFLIVLIYGGGALLLSFLVAVFPSIEILEISRLFERYAKGENYKLKPWERKPGGLPRRVTVAGVLVLFLLAAGFTVCFFDELFPAESKVEIIAHRIGGNEAPENAISGMKIPSDGYETDIRRSKDGVYVINHDASFARTCGVDREVEDMTWEEISQLRILDMEGNPSDQHPPSLEELLDSAKGKGHLYLELKGVSADRKMAADVAAMVEEKGMEDQCSIISLKYDLISYVYHKHPEIEAGFLYYFSFGDKAGLDCDLLLIEEESATDAAIATIHTAGKRVVVWTVNSRESAEAVLNSEADGLITDEMSMCREVKEELAKRDDEKRLLDAI